MKTLHKRAHTHTYLYLLDNIKVDGDKEQMRKKLWDGYALLSAALPKEQFDQLFDEVWIEETENKDIQKRKRKK